MSLQRFSCAPGTFKPEILFGVNASHSVKEIETIFCKVIKACYPYILDFSNSYPYGSYYLVKK